MHDTLFIAWRATGFAALVLLLSSHAAAATYTVTNTNDGGAGSLRQAILDANASPGTDTIQFAIPGTGPHTIQLSSQLPTISDPVVIDGSSQPGFSGAPLIELDGTNAGAGARGLTVAAGQSTVRALVVNRFGTGIFLTTNGGNKVEGCYVGIDAAGAAALANGDGITIVSASNTIGGATPAQRNVISGNTSTGVLVSGTSATGNVISGNYIGTDAAGTAAVGNRDGLVFSFDTTNNRVGGTTASARNVISGNTGDGIQTFAGATTTTIVGNYIGVDVTGVIALGNAGNGVTLLSHGNTIGGAVAAARNVIAGNFTGIQIRHPTSTGNVVAGNYIGVDATGLATLGHGTDGVFLSNAAGNTIGGAVPGAGNVVCSNGRFGIFLFASGSTGNSVQGNYVGVLADGTTAAGNSLQGVRVQGSNNSIGGTTASAGNVIAYNGSEGVLIESGATGNAILSNHIFSNGNRGIGLDHSFGHANDPGDADTGTNNLQNYPVLTSANESAVGGTLNSTANTWFKIQFFASVACDPSGFGEGETFVGETTVTTDGSGDATFTHVFATQQSAGQFLTATATDPSDNTSEFGPCRLITSDRVTYSFTGTASVIDGGGRIGGDGNGVPFTGTFSFDANATLVSFGTTTATYRMTAPLGDNKLFIDIRGFKIEANPSENLEMTVQNLTPAPPPANSTDSFHILSSYPVVTPAITPAAGHAASTIDLVFLDSSGQVFTDKSLPTEFDLADYDLEQIVIQYRDPASAGNILFQITGNLNGLTATTGDAVPPTADAGADQAIHASQNVNLDGSGSFDDTSTAANLQYAWSFAAKPAGSAATLSGANTPAPSFVADQPGVFRVHLVVTDEAGNPSAADEVVISSLNVAPTAEVGDDQVGVVNVAAGFDGTASHDADNDTLSYAWTLVSSPAGSSAALAGANTATPSLTPDVPGDYVVQLIVNDGFVDSVPAQTTLTAISGCDFAQLKLRDASDYAKGLPASSFDTPGHRNYFCNQLARIIRSLQECETQSAKKHLQKVIERTDGVPLRSAVDPKGKGQPHAADFVTDSTAQVALYDLLAAALDVL